MEAYANLAHSVMIVCSEACLPYTSELRPSSILDCRGGGGPSATAKSPAAPWFAPVRTCGALRETRSDRTQDCMAGLRRVL